MSISRRNVLATGAAAITTAAVTAPLAIKAALAAQPDPLLACVQALVNEIRRDLSGEVTCGEFWALQEAADRLEALAGIQPVYNELWDRWRQQYPEEIVRDRSTNWRAIRPVGGLPS